MKDRRTILTIALLILVFVLGGALIYVATRVSAPTPIAPTAPESKPAAAVSCTTEGGVCQLAGMSCPSTITGTDCAAGEVCCKKPWAACNDLNFEIACLPRPACLDSKTSPCTTPEPTGGWCPYLTCDQKKNVYKDDPRNSAGTYYLVDKVSDGGTVYQNQFIVISIPYMNKTSKRVVSATVSDTLDSRLTYVDGDPACKYTSTGSKVTCNIGVVEPNTGAQVSFRVRVKVNATLGELVNSATMATNENSTSMCYSSQTIQPEPKADVNCTAKRSLVSAGGIEASEATAGASFVYSFDIENKGNASSAGFVLRDVLSGDNKNYLSFIDSADGCTFTTSSRTVSCPLSVGVGEKKTVSFKVTVAGSAPNGTVIKNSAATYPSNFTTAKAVSTCTNSITVKNPIIGAVKKAYKDASGNVPGAYTLTEEINNVSRDQTYVYNINVTNTGSGKAVGVNITDTLNGQGQENLSYVDSDNSCLWTSGTKTLSCNVDVDPGANKNVSFRVKVNDSIVNGTQIKNIGLVKLGEQMVTVKKDLTASSIVSCNQVCNSNSECGEGLWCDTTENKCRKQTCTRETSCVCPVAATPTPTQVITAAPTQAPTAAPTAAPTEAPTQAPTAAPTVVVTAAPTAARTPTPTAVAEVTPETLPETGIFDTPGIAAFGGGLLLAVVGILLAL